MEESPLDYQAVVVGLQIENELLRARMKTITDMRDAVNKVPTIVEDLWQKAVDHKYQLLVALMIVYWAVAIGCMVFDRIKG